MLDFLNKLFDWFFQFVPQINIVPPHTESIRITCVPFIIKKTAIKKFGWYLYWPLFQEMYPIVVKQQLIVVELSRETLDNKQIESSWAVQFWIQNSYKALFEVEDYEELLVSHTMRAVGKYLEKDERPYPLDEILDEVRNNTKGVGLYIQRIFPIQITRAHVHKIFFENLAERVGRIVG